ncbi:putative ATP-dependent RNA helicase ddx49 [Phytophthora pseudosyringae]|uniref:Holocytochrome c-type synthase n=1 Tax=Phytophthora pseudosyringae TaxID=221518 RepID=A0A8T1WCX0_9STRA|nr:putative ATP-dependent RNA helicase ddx49 [Phytophthora pseudosyringae]
MTADVNAAAAACPHPPHKAPGKAQGCPVDHSKTDASETQGCPVDHTASAADAGLNAELMRVATHAAGFTVHGSSAPSPDRRLSSARAVSSIPKGDLTPTHQTGTEDKWEYPSEDMYFKAMKRKGWAPKAQQMKTIVAIHNTVNEQSWHEVLKWESFHLAKQPVKLKQFLGKPTEYSPKAKMMNWLGWSVLPFDRHDWIVDRDGKDVRYVIDFYSGQPEPNRPLSVYLDVRPALDSVEGAVDRLRWQFHEKILPLLPFKGAMFGGPTTKTPEAGASQTEDRDDGHSKVTPKTN